MDDNSEDITVNIKLDGIDPKVYKGCTLGLLTAVTSVINAISNDDDEAAESAFSRLADMRDAVVVALQNAGAA